MLLKTQLAHALRTNTGVHGQQEKQQEAAVQPPCLRKVATCNSEVSMKEKHLKISERVPTLSLSVTYTETPPT